MKTMTRVASVALILCTHGWAQSNGPATDKSKILALENAWGMAESLKDTKALESLLDDQLVYIRYDGTQWNKQQYLDSLKDPQSKEEQASNESMTAYLHGAAALVTGIYRVKGVEKGKPYARRERFIDTWMYKDGAWVCVASQVTLITH